MNAPTTRLRVYVNNTGAINDSFNLAASGIPAGWSVVFRADGGANDCSTVGASLTNTGTINNGQARLVCAEVTLPATTSGQVPPGNTDLTFTAVSALNALVTDYKVDRVTVNAVNSVTITPNNTQQTFPGGSVTYTHVITNVGNVAYAVPANPITFAAGFLTDSRSAQGWTSVAYVDGNANGVFDPGVDDVPGNQITAGYNLALAVNATRTIFIRVFAPGSAVGLDPANVTTITATYNTTSTASATDSTTVSAKPCSGNLTQRWELPGERSGDWSKRGLRRGITRVTIRLSIKVFSEKSRLLKTSRKEPGPKTYKSRARSQALLGCFNR